MELWKNIEGLPGYQVSSLGRVKSSVRHSTRCLKGSRTGLGYVSVYFKGGKREYVHRLVAAAFIPNPDNKPHVNHRDSNPSNNHYSNLEWVTHRENIQHALDCGRMNYGEINGQCKLTKSDAEAIRNSKASGQLLAALFNISESTICDIRKNRTWKHLNAA